MADDPVALLAAQLRDALDVKQIDHLVRLSGGASRETWRFIADGRDLILQRQRTGDVRDMGVEIAALRAARAAGVPVAEVVTASATAADIGAGYMVLTAVEGETIARKILRDAEFADARRVLPRQLGAALAATHRIDASAVPGLVVPDQLHDYRLLLDSYSESHPTFELAFQWLAANRPPANTPKVVHGDFRLGNVIIGADGLRAVIDWELAHLGDPMEDLGWLCTKAWRFGAPKPVAGIGDYEELCAGYEEAGGGPADPEVVRWWEVLGTLKWGIMCMGQANTHRSGVVRSHELAAIGRRVCENEYDLFLALDDRWNAAAAR